MNKYQVDEKTGIAYREGTFDTWILNESRGYFPLELRDSDKILDLGGHIGCFAARSIMEKSCCPVESIEAEESNYEVLRNNAGRFDFRAVHAAVVDDKYDEEDISVYVNGLKNNALHSILPVRGRATQVTKGIGLKRVLETFKPSIIKCDIEGAEYDLPWYLLDSYPDVRMVIMELHLTKRGHRDKARNICGDFHDMAFDFTKKPHIGEKNWTTIARFER